MSDYFSVLEALRKRYKDAGKLIEAKAIARAIAVLRGSTK